MITETATIEAAYMAGFEPSSETLTGEALFNEASEYLFMEAFK